jgi:hypothetical protein
MANGMLPWLEPPRNKDEWNELNANLQRMVNEYYAKMTIVAAVTNKRLRTPKTGSKWAQKLAWARVDLRVYARNVTRPMGQSAAAVVAAGKAFQLAYLRFYEINSTALPKDGGSSSGFDFS